MKTVEYQVEGKQTALVVAQALIERSAWFAMEPRPDDWYCFSIKPGEGNEVAFNTVRASYEDGECPDCGETIPDDIVEGGECANCGHVFYTYRECD